MQINGREVHFLRTVMACCKIADICEDGDIANGKKLFSGSYQESQRNSAKFIAILSEGYEENKKFREAGYEPRPLTEEETLNLTDDEFQECFMEAYQAYTAEKPTVETEPVKGKKKEATKSN